MKHLKFALVLVIFIPMAFPAQAAQDCEAEFQNVVRLEKERYPDRLEPRFSRQYLDKRLQNDLGVGRSIESQRRAIRFFEENKRRAKNNLAVAIQDYYLCGARAHYGIKNGPDTQSTERTSTPAAGANPTHRPSAVSRDSGSADLAPVASSPKQVPKSAAVNDCLKFKRDKDNRIELTNVCDFHVQYSWCLKSPDRAISVFACKDPYQGEGSAGLRAGGTTSLQGSTKATGVRWIACRGTIGEVLPLLSQNGKNGCY